VKRICITAKANMTNSAILTVLLTFLVFTFVFPLKARQVLSNLHRLKDLRT
jgi:hypothetical protein